MSLGAIAKRLVLWPDSDLPARPLFRRFWAPGGHRLFMSTQPS
jgi:hypothetical protein